MTLSMVEGSGSKTAERRAKNRRAEACSAEERAPVPIFALMAGIPSFGRETHSLQPIIGLWFDFTGVTTICSLSFYYTKHHMQCRLKYSQG